MKCCRLLRDGDRETLPFERVLATGYYDGPTDGFTECVECRQTYSFRKLDWDGLQDVRIFAFAPLNTSLDAIAARLSLGSSGTLFVIVRPLSDDADDYVNGLFGEPAKWVAAVEGWPGTASVWRDVTGVDLSGARDWFSYLQIARKFPKGTN